MSQDFSDSRQSQEDNNEEPIDLTRYRYQVPWDINLAYSLTYANNRNQNDLSQRELQFSEHKANRDNLLMKDGHLVKLGNGVTLSRSADLIIINQYESTIILNNEDIDEVVAFLED